MNDCSSPKIPGLTVDKKNLLLCVIMVKMYVLSNLMGIQFVCVCVWQNYPYHGPVCYCYAISGVPKAKDVATSTCRCVNVCLRAYVRVLVHTRMMYDVELARGGCLRTCVWNMFTKPSKSYLCL